MFESFGQPHSFWTTQKGGHVFIMDCRFFLNKVNAGYDQVDIQLHVSNNGESTFKLKKWGIRFFRDYSLSENRLGDHDNILPRVCERMLFMVYATRLNKVTNVKMTLWKRRDAESECG